MTPAERRVHYERWIHLLHLERPNSGEMEELTVLLRMFRRSFGEQPSKEAKHRPLPFGREIRGGLPGLGKRR